ncbi:MAG: ABC transporter substrate-binding protein [Nostoc sp. SerVER01]|nr:ABC transporter substrate-binding protein [Nostoc sp. SerVER01]MDZ8080585.1 ABC transporter substrate-binding protein [Nostoc sp. DcaGUA01]
MDARLQDLQNQLAKERELWNELQDRLRYETDPRRQRQLRNDIQQADQRIIEHENEIEKIKQKFKISKIKETQPEILTDNTNQSKLETDNFNPDTNLGTRNNNPSKEPKIRIKKNFKKILFFICILFGCFLAILLYQLTLNSSITICPNGKENSNINLSIVKSLSCGEKSLISGSILDDKRKGVEAYKSNDYTKAIESFEKAIKKEPNDPETLIYLNNAKIEKDKIPAYTIAVAVPISSNLYTSLQILRGVAQAQEEFLRQEGPQPKNGLKVLITDDANDVNRAKQIASILVQQKHILAVIGHYASDATIETRDIYENGQLVSVSPGSTSTELPRPNDRFFFRTIPSLQRNTISLALYLNPNLNSKNITKVAVFHNPSSKFSKSFFSELKTIFADFKIEIVNDDPEERDFHLSNPLFKPKEASKKAIYKGAQAFVLIPDGGTTNYSIPNALKLIKASPKNFVIVGANTLFRDETLLLGEDVVDRLVVTTPWIQTTVSKSNFAKEAEKLWQGREISPWTVTAYDAAKVLIQALFINIEDNPTRLKLRDSLINPTVKPKGADEIFIEFENGNRKKPEVELAKIVKLKCSEFGYSFVPEQDREQDIKQLEASCN